MGKRTGQSCTHGFGIFAVSPQWLNLELGTFELAYAEFTFDYGVKGGAAAGLPTSWGSGQGWDASSEDAPGRWADGFLESVHVGDLWFF